VVFFTDLMIVSSSSGLSVRGSITSTSMSSASRRVAAWSADSIIASVATSVTSRPLRLTAALPMGIA